MSLSTFFSKLWQIIVPPRRKSDGATTEEATTAVADGSAQPSAERSGSDELSDEFESAFESVFGGADSPEAGEASTERNEHDQAQNQELFAGIAANYARPVKDFMFELEAGTAPKEWMEVCRPVLATLSDAAESMELRQIAQLVFALDKELEEALRDEGPWPNTSWKERILFIYGKLVELQPDAFTVDESDRRRESIIIHSLLRQIPEVGYVSLEKLYRVGLTSRDTLFQAGPRDLVTTAGITEELSGLICIEVQAYRDRTEKVTPEQLRQGGLARLSERVPELCRHHEAFTDACNAVDPQGKLSAIRRSSRAKRRELSLEIDLLLAEIGEVELVRELQSLPFGQRIKRLQEFLASSATPATTSSNDEKQEENPTPVGT